MILKAAIVGMGKMGRIRKKVLDAHSGFEVIAICDQDEGLQKEFHDLQFYTRWEDLLLSDLDVIVVCTYNNVAPDIVCASLNKGLHVFCEKPPGRSVADVERIINVKHICQRSVCLSTDLTTVFIIR